MCKKTSSFFWETRLNLCISSAPGKIGAATTFINLQNLHPMVQTDVSQLSAECQEWRQILRNYREEFHTSKKSLEEICRKNLKKDHLTDVEHFDNQFHIQLINIHDLKQFIKAH